MIRYFLCKKSLVVVLCCMVQFVSYAQTQVTRDAKDNTVKTVTFNDNAGPFIDNIEAEVKQYLELGNEHSLKLKFSNEQTNGDIIQRYTLIVNGIPAEHGSVSVLVRNGHASYMNACIYKDANTNSNTPVLSEVQALDKAKTFINAEEYMWENVEESKLTKNNPAFQQPEGTLVWVEDYNNDVLNKQLRLAYRFNLYAKKPLSRDFVYVDAANGNILLKDAIMKHVGATGGSVYSGTVSFETFLLGNGKYSLEDMTRNVYTYDMHGGTNVGASATDFENATTTWGTDYSIDAHWGSTLVYDYWKKEQNRNSFDNAGGNVISLVNYSVNYNNASWDGTFMRYGNGTGMFAGGFEPLMALDVCAHELGHGICQYTSSLVYAKESGAMNEGFSDIWGAVVESYSNVGKDTWTIGEELRVGALRSMSNPKLFNNPDTYGGQHWTNVIGCTPSSGNDRCGVHNNSGVLNHWFYLLAEGGKGFNDNSDYNEISGIGIKKAAQIAYATEQVLTSNATYAECRTVSISIATSLFGACSREVEAVTRAWFAVGVGNAFVGCGPQIGFTTGDTVVNKSLSSTVCPASQTVNIPLRVQGNALSGGNATVTVAGAGNVVDGIDFKVLNNPITFNAGSTASQNVQVSIFDHGDVTKDKELKLYFTITPNGSDAVTSYTYDTCVITLKGEKSVPDTGADRVSQVNIPSVKSQAVTPFLSRRAKGRTQFVISAEELVASGVKPNDPITAIQFNVTKKNSTKAFTDFTIKVSPVSVKHLGAGTESVTTVVFNGNYFTALGWNTFTLTNPITWNGTDNLAFEACFNNSTADAENDHIEAVAGSAYVSATKSSNSGTGCSLSYSGNLSSGFYYSISKPVIRLVQATGIVEAETAISLSNQWDINKSQTVYFNSSVSGKLIANVSNATNGLGCTSVFIAKQGQGMTPMMIPNTPVNRSEKEFTMVALNNNTGTGYDLGLYFDTSELSGLNLANFQIMATTAVHDTFINKTNTVLVTPTHMQVNGYHTFTATFTGGAYPKYFLVDNAITIPDPKGENVGQLSKNSGNIRVVNNPFNDRVYINYNLLNDTKASVRLFDITGKVVYTTEKNLSASQNGFEINLSNNVLIPGNYVLQVITDTEVMVNKMVKQ